MPSDAADFNMLSQLRAAGGGPMTSQLEQQTGMGRPGGAASRGSEPVRPTKGRKFAAMENAMLKQMRPKPKKLAMGKSSAQFRKGPGENTGQGQ